MDSPPDQPIVLANRVIKQLTDHLLAGAVTPEEEDFNIIRVVFRKLGGNWTDLYKGDIEQTKLLEKVVTNWGITKQKAEDA